MARINIEDSIFKDIRFLKLIQKTQSIDEALGNMVRAWLVAQKYWVPEKCPIPLADWDKQGISNILIEVGLATKEDSGVYVHGSEEQFEWMFKLSAAGKKSAASRKIKYGSSQPYCPEQGLNIDEQPLNTPEPLRTSSSSSSSNTKNNTSSASPPEILNSVEQTLQQMFVPKSPDRKPKACWDLDALYQEYPRKQGKSTGMKKLTKIIDSQEKYDNFKTAIFNYRELLLKENTEPNFVKHFSTFVNCWEDYLHQTEQTIDFELVEET